MSEDKIRYELMLVGGALKTCSSMATNNCTKNIFAEQLKSEVLYQLSTQNRDKFIETVGYKNISAQQKMQLNELIQHIYADNQGAIVNSRQLRELFTQAKGLDLYRSLDDSVYYALLDSLEHAQVDQQGKRKQEVTSLEQTENQNAIAIYQRFVQQAAMRKSDGQAKPKIAVITASSRDPFEVADFYQSVFTEAGAEVIWLPLDISYQQAREKEANGQQGCSQLAMIRGQNNSYYREQIYPQRTALQLQYCQHPEQMLNALASVQGVFFNGGDQSLTLSALLLSDGTDSHELRLIKQQVKSGNLIVGGTSAGTAVQAGGVLATRPIPMITNGDPANALPRGAFANQAPSQRCLPEQGCTNGLLAGDLTYRADGGTGLFNLGLLDTHFSERDRETRLAVFSAETRQRFAFGVDETTALLVSGSDQTGGIQMEVIGQNGVFIIDRQQSRYSVSSQSTDVEREHVIVSAESHYLNAGSRALFDTLKQTLAFELAGETLTSRQVLAPIKHGQWRDQIRAQCGSRDMITWSQYVNTYQLSPSAKTVFSYNVATDHCSYTHLPFVISNP